jgi:phage terminase large subunit
MRRDRDRNWWRVYGLGEVGSAEGLIHGTFSLCDEFPSYGDDAFYGLDFGYNDPCALVRCKILNDCLVCDQLLYEAGLTNQDLSKRFASLGIRKGYDEIIADCAEPKSIQELYRDGWNVKPAIKGPDSVVAGIQKVNQYKQFWTKRSIDAIKEMRNYMWDKDKEGKLINKPCDNGYDHLLDARRYGLSYRTLKAQGAAYRVAI